MALYRDMGSGGAGLRKANGTEEGKREMGHRRVMRRRQERACGGKVGYDTEADASGCAQARLRDPDCNASVLRAYQCKACGKWHLPGMEEVLPLVQNPPIGGRREV